MRILRIDSSAQTETSQSRRLSNRIIDGLRALGKSPDVTVRDLDKRLPQLDRAWIEANTTPIDDRTDYQRKTLALSDTHQHRPATILMSARPHRKPFGRDIGRLVSGIMNQHHTTGFAGPAFKPVDIVSIHKNATQRDRGVRDHAR